eukprot:SAG11_NODE_1506_length_4781_cov_2.355831_6_plen_147_part_00
MIMMDLDYTIPVDGKYYFILSRRAFAHPSSGKSLQAISARLGMNLTLRTYSRFPQYSAGAPGSVILANVSGKNHIDLTRKKHLASKWWLMFAADTPAAGSDHADGSVDDLPVMYRQNPNVILLVIVFGVPSAALLAAAILAVSLSR